MQKSGGVTELVWTFRRRKIANDVKREVVHGLYQGALYIQNITFLRFACKLNLIYARNESTAFAVPISI